MGLLGGLVILTALLPRSPVCYFPHEVTVVIHKTWRDDGLIVGSIHGWIESAEAGEQETSAPTSRLMILTHEMRAIVRAKRAAAYDPRDSHATDV